MKKLLFILVSAAFLLTGIRAALYIRDVSAKPRTIADVDSPFFRAYRPGMVTTRFYLTNQTCTGGFTKTGGMEGPRALISETTCVIRTDSEAEFVEALRTELLQTLNAAHAVVTKQEDHGVGGYRCEYRSGHSTGSVAIAPLERQFGPEGRLPEDVEKVHLMLRVDEEPRKWW